jgi:hypothetical protein
MNLEEVRKKTEEKSKRYEEKGVADKEFIRQLDGKQLKMWLPSSVFDQQRMITLASEVYHKSGNYIEEELRHLKEYSSMVFKHTSVEGKIIDPELYTYADLEAYPLLYWVELLSPLFSWGQARSKKLILE